MRQAENIAKKIRSQRIRIVVVGVPGEQIFSARQDHAVESNFPAAQHCISLAVRTRFLSCPPWYHWNRGPGWLSSQGVLQSEETKI